MARPNLDRVTVTAYISRADRDHLDRVAAECQVKRSDVLRLALQFGLYGAEFELRRQGRGAGISSAQD